MECGKCSSIHAAIRSISSALFPPNGTTSATVGSAFVNVPVLSNTIVSASATASIYLPPFTVTLCWLASRIADNTEIGMASFNAQEKSTIRTAIAFVAFLVAKYTSPVPAKVYGTSLSAKCSALPSRPDFNFCESSIIVTILS